VSERREWVVALSAAWALVLLRSAVLVAYEQSYFDSDQAIVGLMAKHLAEGRAFPLFFYGQSYMLGVESWVAAPFLWLGGPSVVSLRAAMVALNLAAVTLVMVGLWKGARLRPRLALVAALFFAIAPPFTSALLLEAQGGSIEPFVYVALLWWLRNRPAWFGAVLGLGFLNREFTLYAVPVVVTGQLVGGRFWRRETARAWLVSVVTFFVVWEGVNALKPYADLMGPGTRGQLLQGFAGSQMGDVANRTEISLREWPIRAATAVSRLFTRLTNGRHVEDVVTQGHDWLWWPIVLGVVLLAARIGWVASRARAAVVRGAAFCWYLVGVGVVALAVLAAARSPEEGTLRYLLLALLVPIGLVGGLFAIDRNALVRRVVIAAVLAWAVVSGFDNVTYIRRYTSGREPNDLREFTDTLVARGLPVAEADYWRAYKITFLAAEKIKVASTNVSRIAEYQELAGAAGDNLLRIQEAPCTNGERIGGFFLCATK
jgi:hypothetical protein